MTITTSIKHASKLASWIKDCEGIAVWQSINLSNPGKQMFTPVKDAAGKPYTKPSWEMGDTPAKIVLAYDDVLLCKDTEVKRFHVAVRQSGNGLTLKCTDASSEKIRKEVEKAGDDSHYEFDYGEYKNCIIFAVESKITLSQWIKEQK
jgi:hypothetical protein